MQHDHAEIPSTSPYLLRNNAVVCEPIEGPKDCVEALTRYADGDDYGPSRAFTSIGVLFGALIWLVGIVSVFLTWGHA